MATIVGVVALKTLMSAMAVRPRSRTELQEITGLCNSTITRYMQVLANPKDKHRIAYIAAWKPPGKAGWPTALYMMGYGMPDMPRPRALTAAEYKKRARAKEVKLASVSIISTSTGVIHVQK